MIYFIIVLILFYSFFYFSYIKPKDEAEARKIKELLRNEGIKREVERKVKKSKEKMQNHPLLTPVENCLIAEIDAHLRWVGSKKISPTKSDILYFYIKYDVVKSGYEEVSFSSFGYDCFESGYDLQAFGESLYHSLKTHYANHSGLSWGHYYKDETSVRESYYEIIIDFTACHPKLKSI